MESCFEKNVFDWKICQREVIERRGVGLAEEGKEHSSVRKDEASLGTRRSQLILCC